MNNMPASTRTSDQLLRHPDFSDSAPLLDVRDLQVDFQHGKHPSVRVVNKVSYSVAAGETLAVIGESGCGKSITSRAIMGILPPKASITGGEIRIHGVDTVNASPARSRQLRGTRLAMIFQDSLSALNPVLSVGYQIAEVFRVHQKVGRRQAMVLAIEALDMVKIPSPERRVHYYPHEFSGGMRQRAMIAMALAMNPEVLIADEPTTALDVTVQAQIMELLKELQESRRMGLVLITHDLGVVAEAADNVMVMYAGRVVERSSADLLYADPRHPYTRSLLASVPRRGSKGAPLTILPGSPPDPSSLPTGCSFAPRCEHRQDACSTEPRLYKIVGNRSSACHRERVAPE